MNVLIILACVFGGLFLIVTLTERYGKPMSEEQQSKYSKIIPILVIVAIIGSMIQLML